MPGHISGNATWTETVSTPVRAANLEDIEAVLDQTHPFAGLRTQKLYMAQGERVTATSGAEVTMLNVTGPGCIRTIWMAAFSNAGLDGRIRVYYDGSSTPAVDIDCGTLFALHYGAGSQAGTHYTPHLSAQINSVTLNTGYLIQYPIPFGTSVKVTFYNPDTTISGGNGFYYMVTYNLTSQDWAAGLRFRCASVGIASPATVTATQTYTMASLTGPGWLVGLSYVGGISATNLTWMERDFQFAVDGESTPSPGSGTQLVTTGTEDTFDSAWYYQGGWRDFQSSINSYIGTDQPTGNVYVVGQTTDYWSKWGGIPFNSSCVVTLLTESACTTGHSFTYGLTYYA